MTASLRRIGADRRGATVVEFAIVIPVLATLLMGLGDLLYTAYLQAILTGAVQKAGRDSSLEQSALDQSSLDAGVTSAIKSIASDAAVSFQRRSYASFALVKPEYFDDTNADGIRQPGECFDDVNGNGAWDADPGRGSQGGANDVTRYTVTVSYPRLFPVSGLIGLSAQGEMSASTLLKNQPYKTQTVATIKRICT
jgi:Flp pilus assembly protein TadG